VLMYGDGSLYGGTLSCPGFVAPWARSATPTPARLHVSMPNAIDAELRILRLLPRNRNAPSSPKYVPPLMEGPMYCLPFGMYVIGEPGRS